MSAPTADARALAPACLLASFAGTGRARRGCCARLDGGLGGVCLFGSNVVDAEQLGRADRRRCTRPRADVVVALDEEGGDVTRLEAAHRQLDARATPRWARSTTSR